MKNEIVNLMLKSTNDLIDVISEEIMRIKDDMVNDLSDMKDLNAIVRNVGFIRLNLLNDRLSILKGLTEKKEMLTAILESE